MTFVGIYLVLQGRYTGFQLPVLLVLMLFLHLITAVICFCTSCYVRLAMCVPTEVLM
jgi:hypothetical protein